MSPKIKKETSAGIIIYRRTPEGPKFLLLYRGYWSFSKGKLEEGEKSFKAALREVKEETGLLPRDLRFRDYFRVIDRYVFTRNGGKIYKTVVFYLAESRRKEIKLSSEQDGYGWFSYRETLRHLQHRNLKSNLSKALHLIERRRPAPPKISGTGRP